jgi:hypothetical protein
VKRRQKLTLKLGSLEGDINEEYKRARGLQMDKSQKPSRRGSVSCAPLEIDGGSEVEEVVGLVVMGSSRCGWWCVVTCQCGGGGGRRRCHAWWWWALG